MSTKTRMAAAAAALCLGLTACGGGGQPGETPTSGGSGGGSVNYVVPTSWANVGALKEVVADFQKESGITVNIQAIPDENYNSVVGSRLAGGTDIDVFAGSYTLFDVPNVMVDLTAEEGLKHLTDEGRQSITWTDGKVYSFPSPTAGATFGVFYNRAVFEKAGVSVPGSLDELTAAMGKLKAAGVTPLYLAGKDGWTLLQHRNSANALMNLSGDTIAKLNKNEVRWDAVPELKDQYEALQGWVKDGYINADALTGTYEQSQKAVVEGKAGMLINGTWVIGEITKLSDSAKKDIGFFPLPAKNGSTMLGLSGADGLHIAKKSPNIDNAKKFLTFLSNQASAQKFMDEAPGISNFTDVKVPADAPQALTDVVAAVAKGSTLAIDNASLVPAPEADLIAAYQELVAGKSTAADFLRTEADGMIAAGKQAGLPGF